MFEILVCNRSAAFTQREKETVYQPDESIRTLKSVHFFNLMAASDILMLYISCSFLTDESSVACFLLQASKRLISAVGPLLHVMSLFTLLHFCTFLQFTTLLHFS